MDQAMYTAELAIAPGVREVASEDGAVLLDVEQGVCFSLNPVGLKIWELLKKGCSLDQIADALGQEFPVSRPQLLSDATEFVAALEEKLNSVGARSRRDTYASVAGRSGRG